MPDKPRGHKMPERSFLFDRIIPIALILLGIIMVLMIAFAIGVVTGLIHWT